MKLLIMFFFILSLSICAQEKEENTPTSITPEFKEWMTKISLNQEMREEMLVLILDNTSEKNSDSKKLGRIILDNSRMKEMISQMIKSDRDYLSMQPKGYEKDTSKAAEIKQLQKK